MPVLDVSVNATRIMQTIWMYPGISRIDLSRKLNLNKSTITKIVATLLDDGLIVLAEQSYVTDGKGRRPTGLFINEHLGVVLGIEIRTESWNAVVINLRGEVLQKITDQPISPNTDLIVAVEDAIRSSSARQVASGHRVLGAAIGLSGQINPYDGIVLSSNPLNVAEPLNLYEEMQNRFPFPVLVENDANCCCWNVMMEKREKRDRNFLCVLGEFRRIGIGPEDGYSEIEGIAVGLGVVIKDSVLHGDNYSAGEFQSIFKNNINPSQFNLSISEVSDISKNDALLEQVIRELARNVALLVNVLNITHIRVYGDFIRDPELIAEALEDEIDKNWLYDTNVNCSVVVDGEHLTAVATGAAAFFLNRLYSVPDIHDEYGGSYPFGIEMLRLSLETAL